MASEGLISNLSRDNSANIQISGKFSENKEQVSFADFISKTNKEPEQVKSKEEAVVTNIVKDNLIEEDTNDLQIVETSWEVVELASVAEILTDLELEEVSLEENNLAPIVASIEIPKAKAPKEIVKIEVANDNLSLQNLPIVQTPVAVIEDEVAVVTNNELKPIISQNSAQLNLEKLSSEEQVILLQMEKDTVIPKEILAQIQNGIATKLVAPVKPSLVPITRTTNTEVQAVLASPMNDSVVITKEPVVLSQANLIMADNTKQGSKILRDLLQNNPLAENEVVIEDNKFAPAGLEKLGVLKEVPAVEIQILPTALKDTGKTADKLLLQQNNEEVIDFDFAQDEEMSFDNKFGKISDFAIVDNSKAKLDISFDDFITVNKDTAILKPSEQIAISLKHAVSEGKSAVSISLYPKALGHIDVKIEFATNSLGQSEVQKVIITADRPSTLKILENTKMQLETSLAELKKEAATTVTETSKKEASLQFDMKNGNNGGQNESYFGSFEERENWMNKFININENSGLNQEGEMMAAKSKPHYITSTAIDIEV